MPLLDFKFYLREKLEPSLTPLRSGRIIKGALEALWLFLVQMGDFAWFISFNSYTLFLLPTTHSDDARDKLSGTCFFVII